MKRIAFYGGTFDPVHLGHITIADKLTQIFELDEFVFVPAFHAPHKKRYQPTHPLHRYAMLCLATNTMPKFRVSRIEIEAPERPYTIDTLSTLRTELPEAALFFVIGADSWAEIDTWRDWEKVLTIVNIIVVTRPGFEIGYAHVTDDIRGRIVDKRTGNEGSGNFMASEIRIPGPNDRQIYLTDAVQMDISATGIRRKISENISGWRELLPADVAKYIEKYDIYN